MTTRITSENITDATITSTDLAAGAGSTDWQAVITADGSTVTTMVSGRGYFVNTTSAAGIVKFPASASRGDYVEIKDYARTFGTNNVTVQRNGHNIDAAASDATLSTNGKIVKFVYMDSTRGWTATNDDDASAYGAVYTSASGGTETTSGDFKIHTFTGDGNFIVSTVGNPAGSTDKVSYMVVAGGGSGGLGSGVSDRGAGGGAGGYREGKTSNDPYSASPIVAPDGLTVTATTYPITVGGGAAAKESNATGNDGSNSVFSTITSTGGGGGGRNATVGNAGGSGGGFGGGSGSTTPIGGAGNTPPVSPPQGNAGGRGGSPSASPNIGGGGGGGATSVGSDAVSGGGGNGGTAATSSINGTPTARAGGGGGDKCAGSTGGGASGPGACQAATANTGGGGQGGYPSGGGNGTAGGKGIVIIRYKYQN